MTGPNDPVGGPANDDDGEGVEAHVGEHEMAPTGPTLEVYEEAAIEGLRAAILTENRRRVHPLSVEPEDVN